MRGQNPSGQQTDGNQIKNYRHESVDAKEGPENTPYAFSGSPHPFTLDGRWRRERSNLAKNRFVYVSIFMLN